MDDASWLMDQPTAPIAIQHLPCHINMTTHFEIPANTLHPTAAVESILIATNPEFNPIVPQQWDEFISAFMCLHTAILT